MTSLITVNKNICFWSVKEMSPEMFLVRTKNIKFDKKTLIIIIFGVLYTSL